MTTKKIEIEVTPITSENLINSDPERKTKEEMVPKRSKPLEKLNIPIDQKSSESANVSNSDAEPCKSEGSETD
jgi:hypothetical protein